MIDTATASQTNNRRKRRFDLDRLRTLAADETLSVVEIAGLLGLPTGYIYYVCKRESIPLPRRRRADSVLIHKDREVQKLAGDAQVSLGQAAFQLGVSASTLRNFVGERRIAWVSKTSQRHEGCRDRRALFLHLSGQHLMTEAQIGRAFEITREAVRQALCKARQEEESSA